MNRPKDALPITKRLLRKIYLRFARQQIEKLKKQISVNDLHIAALTILQWATPARRRPLYVLMQSSLTKNKATGLLLRRVLLP